MSEKKKNKDIEQEKEEKTTQAEQAQDDSKVTDISVEDLVEKLNEANLEIERLNKHAQEMTDLATRLQADFDNYRKRTNETNKRVHSDGMAEVIEKIIPVIDVVEQALQMIKDEGVKKGVLMIEDNFLSILNGLGVKEIEAEGLPFDPKVHEAIMQVDKVDDEESGIVKQVFQKGYSFDDRILRASKVIVTK